MIEIKTYSKPKKTGGPGGSSSSTKYISGVISEAEHAGRADKAKRAEVADQANYAGTAASAQNAAYASEAGNLREDAEILLQYLCLKATKDPQVVKGMVNFENIIRFLGDVYMGNMSGSGEFNHSGIIHNTGDIENNGNITNIGGVLNDGDITNTGTMKTKNLEVTGAAHFFQLIIDKVKAMGGALLITPADGFDVDIVEKVSGGYKLYWRCQDEDGHQRDNMWKVNDQALCMSFNRARIGKSHAVSNKYYWSLVTEVNNSLSPIDKDGVKYHYILISDTVRVGGVQPEVSDSIVMLGHRGTDEDRKSAIYISAYKSLDMGLTAPCFAQYRGIDDFDLSNHRQSYLDAKGAKFIGDFEVSSGESLRDLINEKASKDDLNTKANKDDLKQYASKEDLKTTEASLRIDSKNIALSVSEKSIARRNLLVGSAFLREDNNCMISSDARIEMNTGYQGTNCIKIIDDTTDGKTRYPGAFWDGSTGGKSVKITKGKKYVISCWYFSNDANGHLILEALYTDKQTNAIRKGAPKYLSAGGLVPKPNQWQLFTTVIDTTDAESDYIAFNFYEYCDSKAGLIEAYICRPMVEEGDVYNGWTLSQGDYDIIGANLIDNSRTLDAGGNVIEAKGQKALVGDAYELTASGSDDYNTFYRIKGSTFKLGVDYTISFEVRGDAKYMGAYVSYPVTNTKFTCYKEKQNGAMIETIGDGKTIGYVALVEVKELSKQQRVWGHFRFKDRLPEELYFQFPSNAEQTDVTSWSVTITKPKIEVGAVVTEYTERKSDLVDKVSLKAAGININKDYVEIYGDKVKVSQTEGGKPIALFADGKINAQLINATNIVTEGLQAQTIDAKNATLENLNVKNVQVTGSLRNPFVDYDNHMDNNYTDNVIIYDMYNKNLETDYELLWDSSQNGRLIRIANIYSLLDRAPAATAIFTAPKGQCFFENGLMKDTLYIGPSQIVELLGIGDINYGGKHLIGGWVVMNRINLLNDNRFRTSNVYGNKLGIILMGTSENIFAFDSVDTNIMYNRTSDKRFKFEKTGNGVWKLKYPSEWVDNKYMYANDELAIQVTCTAPGCYATSRLGFESLNITTYKGTSPTYDTSFYFEVKNMLEMLPII